MNQFLILCIILLAACSGGQQTLVPDAATVEPRLRYAYESSELCKGCHSIQHLQYQESMHAKAYDNPVFKSLYFNKIVPRARQNRALRDEARQCIYCHAPVAYMNYTGLISTPQQAEAFETGVTCDFCHTLSGFKSNGDYEQNPNQKKQGPFPSINTFHAEYSGYLQVAEFCGNCHNASNHSGLQVKSTFNEWRDSSFSKNIVVCQNCHMNKNGFLISGRAEFESGTVAHVNLMDGTARIKQQDKLYTHAFPGAHSNTQISGAIQLDLKVQSVEPDEAGILHIVAQINNSRAGHNMPTGSSDLRFMWLDIVATTESGQRLAVDLKDQSPATENNVFAVAGASPFDTALLGDDVPKGARLYRAVFADAQGTPSLFHTETVSNLFDNRLKAEEIRNEALSIHLPVDYTGSINLSAKLCYRGVPSSFTRSLGVEDVAPVVIASVEQKITIIPKHSGRPH